MHGSAAALPLDVVRLLNRERDVAIVVTGEHLRTGWRTCKEVEGQSAIRILAGISEREPKLKEAVEQPMLGRFDLPPAIQVSRPAEVGNCPVVVARRAIPMRRGRVQ